MSTPLRQHLDPAAAAAVGGWAAALSRVATAGPDLPHREDRDASLVDLLSELETLKNVAAAAQARITVALEASQRRAQADAGVPAARQGRGVASQVALARRESPIRGQQHLALATVLTREMPHTFARFAEGSLTEWRATLLARETACLDLADRHTIDRLLCADPTTLLGVGDRALAARARQAAQELNPAACVRRARKAHSERHVTIRPAPDTMTHLTGLLPVTQGVAVYAALKAEADRLIAAGDPRSRGQVMADTLVARTTGVVDDGAALAGPTVPLRVSLVMTDRTLLVGGDEPALIPGHDPVPAQMARDLVFDAADRHAAWLRRLYTHPDTGDLTARDSRSRIVPAGLGDFVDTRDAGTCRTPWCDAPIRHHDHATAVSEGGTTRDRNLQGLCEACNHAKQAPGWHARPRPGPRHTVETTTPTGHTHRSHAPPLPGTCWEPATGSHRYRVDLVLTA